MKRRYMRYTLNLLVFLLPQLFSCGIEPDIYGPRKIEAIRTCAPYLAGEWSDSTTRTDGRFERIVFQTTQQTFKWIYYSHSLIDTTTPFAESFFKSGTWRVANDTLFLKFSYFETHRDSLGNQVDRMISSGTAVSLYTLNDTGRLALREQIDGTWCFFQRIGPPLSVPIDTTFFSVRAPNDTIIGAYETLKFMAQAVKTEAGIKSFIWFLDSGDIKPAATPTGELTVVWDSTQTGLHMCTVRAIDSNGIKSAPDYFEVYVGLYRPIVNSRDTTCICNGTGSYTYNLSGFDTNGTIVQYFWRKGQNGLLDSGTTGNIPLQMSCISKCTLNVYIKDNSGIPSIMARNIVTVAPALSIGRSYPEYGVSVLPLEKNCLVLGAIDSGSLYERLVYLAKIDSTGRSIQTAVGYPGTKRGPYGYNSPAAILRNVNGDIVVCGTNDDSYSTFDYGFLIGFNDLLSIHWSALIRDSAAIGGGFSSVRTLPNGDIIAGGFSVLGSYSNYSTCPFLVRTSPDGLVLWKRSYPFHIWHSGKIATSPKGEIYFLSDSVLLKTDSTGTLLWSKMLACNGAGLAVLPSDDLIAAANSVDGISVALQPVSPDGTIKPEVPVNGIAGVHDLQLLADGSLLLVAPTTAMRCSMFGQIIWQKTIDQVTLESGAETSDRSILLTGSTSSFGGGKSDIIVIKLTSNGERVW